MNYAAEIFIIIVIAAVIAVLTVLWYLIPIPVDAQVFTVFFVDRNDLGFQSDLFGSNVHRFDCRANTLFICAAATEQNRIGDRVDTDFFFTFQNIIQSIFNIFCFGIIQLKNIDAAVELVQIFLGGNQNNAVDHAICQSFGTGDKLDSSVERHII